MLGWHDTLTLAATKLRSRRIRLTVTLIISGLLFTGLVAASLVVRGTLASLNSFTKDGFSSRFFVAAYDIPDNSAQFNPAVIKRAETIQKDRVAKKTAEAKRLGIPYDPATEPKLTLEGGPEGPKQLGLDTSQPAAVQALRELTADTHFADTLKSTAQGYGLVALYSGKSLMAYGGSDGELTPVVDSKETKLVQTYGPSQDSLGSFSNTSQTLDDSLIKPFLLTGSSLTTAPGQPVPLLAPVDAVEKLVGLSPLPSKATSAQKLARLKEIRSKAQNLVFDVCYRNQAAVGLRAQAEQQAAEIAANKGKADYVVPSLQYAPPSQPCSPTIISKDTRTADEKHLAAKTDQFKALFGATPPQTTRIKFRVVGILPHLEFGAGTFDLASLAASIVTSTLGNGWFISGQAAAAHPILSQLISNQSTRAVGPGPVYYAEFSDRAGQKRFLDERTCQSDGNPSNQDPAAACRQNHKFFMAPYGNPLAALYDAKEGLLKALRIALIVIGTMSAIIMMGTIGKIIADSRKETSVFRAVGAKRLDIAQIYLLYAGMLATLAFTLSLCLGLGIALFVESKSSPPLSVAAVLAFNSPNADKVFHLIGLNPLDMLGIFAFALATGLASAVLPLLTNLRRNPIKDMREE